MPQRALLIASVTEGLTGCTRDVDLMRTLLEDRGWDAVDVRARPDEATRDGIIDGLEALVAATGPGDGALVHFSGHGARTLRPDWEARRDDGLDPYFRYLVATDIDDSTDDDFRGLLSEELTVIVRRLTDRSGAGGATPGVTVVLDCCHAALLARAAMVGGGAVRASSREHPTGGIPMRLARARGPDTASGSAATNPWAVRLVACQPDETALELPGADGEMCGVFTEALVRTLRDLGAAPVSWETIARLVRHRVLERSPEQRPAVEGPSALGALSQRRLVRPGALPVDSGGGDACIPAAGLFGVRTGDSVRLEDEAGATLGTARVDEVHGSAAWLRMNPPLAGATLPPGIWAVPVQITLPPKLVAVDAPGRIGEAVRAALASTPNLDAATGDASPFAWVRAMDGGLVVCDDAGARLHATPEPADAVGTTQVIARLERLAAGRRIRELDSGEGTAQLRARADVELLTIEAAGSRPRAPHGERLRTGERVAIRMRNRSTEELYAWVFDVGVTGDVQLLTNAAPDGTRVGPRFAADDRYVLYAPSGTPLIWPPSVPAEPGDGVPDRARPETFVVILADRPQDLRPLETRDAPADAAPRSALCMLLDDVRGGVLTDRGDAAFLRYRVHHLDFLLEPP